MKKLMLIACIALLALASCERLRPAPTPTPTPVPSTETAVPPAATPLPLTATAVPPTPTPLPTEAAFPRRNYPAVIKADFEPRPQDWIGKIPFLKELGINTIIIHMAYLREWGEEHRLAYPPPLTGEYELVFPHPPGAPPSEEYLRELIVTAREAGFAVLLGPLVGRIGDPSPIEQIDDWDRFKEDSIEIAVQWAAIAEELQVEYFMPFCELNAVLFAQEAPERPEEPRYTFDEAVALITEWDSKALPQIRAVFSGKLISQIFSTYPGSLLQYPVAGYDIFGIALYPPHPDVIEEARMWTRWVLDDAQVLAKREGVEWMIAETALDPMAFGGDENALETQAEFFRMVTEEYLRTTTVPPVGFGTFLDLTIEGYDSLEGTPSEQVLREFFARLDQTP